MKKFVFVYYGGNDHEGMDQETKTEIMNKWTSWFETFGEKMIDAGNPFAKGGQEVSATESKEIENEMWPAKGYTVINAENMEDAKEIARGCPGHEEEGFAIRVYEAMKM